VTNLCDGLMLLQHIMNASGAMLPPPFSSPALQTMNKGGAAGCDAAMCTPSPSNGASAPGGAESNRPDKMKPERLMVTSSPAPQVAWI
jgi:hypothetical protein